MSWQTAPSQFAFLEDCSSLMVFRILLKSFNRLRWRIWEAQINPAYRTEVKPHSSTSWPAEHSTIHHHDNKYSTEHHILMRGTSHNLSSWQQRISTEAQLHKSITTGQTYIWPCNKYPGGNLWLIQKVLRLNKNSSYSLKTRIQMQNWERCVNNLPKNKIHTRSLIRHSAHDLFNLRRQQSNIIQWPRI